MKKKRNRLWLKRSLIIIGCIYLAISFSVIMNELTREKIILDEHQFNSLKYFFSAEHIGNVSFYKGGLFSIGASKALCNSVYINPRANPYFALNESSAMSIGLLIHETMHTWQARKGCLRMITLSLGAEYWSFFSTGEIANAYYYSISQSKFNMEQEANIPRDLFLILNEDSFIIHCTDCQEVLSEAELDKIYNLSREVILKYA